MTTAEGAQAGPATGATTAPSARPAAIARQAPTDLTLAFVNETTVREVAAARGDP